MCFALDQGWWPSQPFRAGRSPSQSVLNHILGRLWLPLLFQTDQLPFYLLYILVSLKTSPWRKIGSAFKQCFKTTDSNSNISLYNDETEVRAGGGSDLSRFIWPISRRAEMGSLASWPGQRSFSLLAVNHLHGLCVWLPWLDCGLLGWRTEPDARLVSLLVHRWLAAGEVVPCHRLQMWLLPGGLPTLRTRTGSSAGYQKLISPPPEPLPQSWPPGRPELLGWNVADIWLSSRAGCIPVVGLINYTMMIAGSPAGCLPPFLFL